MDLLTPKRYPMIRGFAMVALILLTIGAVTATLEWQEQQDDQLWSAEHAPHPWPWPGQERWPRPLFDFGPVFARTASPSPEPKPMLAVPYDRLMELESRHDELVQQCRAIIAAEEGR